MDLNFSVSVRVNRGRISRLLHLPSGPVGRMIRTKTERVAAEARRTAPGTMKERITVRVDTRRGEVSGVVALNHPAARYVLFGTRPHVIRPIPNRPNPHLRFTVGGRVVYARLVNHPGNRPNPFLQRALRAARG